MFDADERWDALGPSEEKVKDEDDTSGVKVENANQEEYDEGRIWRVQAHARSSVTAMKIDPVNGSGVSFIPLCGLPDSVYRGELKR